MAPLDALTQARIRSLEVVVAWLIEQSLMEDADHQPFLEAALSPTYIIDLAEKISAIDAEETDG